MTTSTLTLKVTKAHHNKSIVCQAQNGADPYPRSANITLLVQYAPQVNVTANRNPIYEGDDVVFRCDAHANPAAMTFRWFVADNIVPGNHGTEFRIDDIGRGRNNEIVKCEVHNEIGRSEDTKSLNISYAPRFVLRPESVSGDQGQNVVLACKVDGNPAPTYTWFRNGDMKTVIELSLSSCPVAGQKIV